MAKTKRSPDALNALYDKYINMLKSGKPQREVELALKLPEKYAKNFLARAGEEGLWQEILGKAQYQIFFGKSSLAELASKMLGKDSSFLGKDQIWKVQACGDGSLIIEPHQIEIFAHNANIKTIPIKVSLNPTQNSTTEE